MKKDYSNIPTTKTIVNNSGNDIVIELRDVLQAPATIKNGESLTVCVKTSEGLAMLEQKLIELNLESAEVIPIEIQSTEELVSALETAEDGATIKLTSNIVANDNITLNKNITLDLSGNNLEIGTNVLNITGDVVLSGKGKINSDNENAAIQVSNGKLIIDGADIESTKLYGISVTDKSEIVVNSGSITSKDSCISTNNTSCDYANIRINGGTLNSNSDCAIYLPSPGRIIINDGELNGGISARMGDVIINGGTINSISSNNDLIEEYYNFSGNVWLGDAIACMAGTYTSRSKEYTNDLSIAINGGTINGLCSGCSAITIYNLGKVEQNISVTINEAAKLTVADETQPVYKVVDAKDIIPESKSDYAKYTKYTNTVIESV